MYENFYGFKEKPFQIVPNPEYLYKSQKHQSALTYLEYGISENVGFILLTGEIGSGKTTLVQYMLNRLGNEFEVAVIFNTNVSAYQLLGLIISEFELNQPSRDKAVALDTLNQFLIEKYAEKKQVLLIIDEAQNLSSEALEEIRMLSNLQTENQALLQIMLVGQPDLLNKLRKPNLMQLSQRIAVNFHLEGLSREEAVNYIAYRLQKAGGRPDLFTEKAVEMIFEMSGGIPRSINLFCQAALVYGFADEAQMISKDIIDQIIEDKVGFSLEARDDDQAAIGEPRLLAELPETAMQRLESLETDVHELRQQVQTQIQKLEKQAEGSKKDLINRLNQLLEKERKRSEILLRRYTQLNLKYDALKRIRAKLEKELDVRLEAVTSRVKTSK
ncbi:MAG: XrtA-associated ATPase [Deltaproteobacteria bacterium]|nr:XrtA-associated ATPase [Deltaproteobacteria bacterium]